MVLELSTRHSNCCKHHKKRKKAILNLQTQTFFRNNYLIVNVLADTHFSFLAFLTAHTVPTRSFFVYHGSKSLIYDGVSQKSCKNVFLMKISTCRDGTLKNQPN